MTAPRSFGALRRSLADPGLLRLRAAAVTYATALLSGVLACVPAIVFGVGSSIVVLAVMLSITVTAERVGRTSAQRLLSLLLLPAIGIGAGAVALLMFSAPLVGDPLFVLVLAAAIWIRRYGPVAQRIGTLIALPFITVLVVPAPVRPGQGFIPWSAAIAFVVAAVALGVQWIARASGLVPPGPRATAANGDTTPSTVSGDGSARRAVAPRTRVSRMRPIPSTRMAVQMAATLAAAFLLGRLVFGEHWFWVVLTAYIVASGNRGRGDVLFKGIHRTVGAAAGTIVAAFLSLLGPASSGSVLTGAGAGMSVLAIAIILAVGLWLRPAGYGWWAAAMTAMLSLLHELTGTAPGPVMAVRLAAIVVGGVAAVAAAWWVLPVPTSAALRSRTAAALAALSELLVACAKEPDAIARHRSALKAAVIALQQLGPTLRLQRATRLRSRSDDHRADIIPAVAGCANEVDAIASSLEHGHPLPAEQARELASLVRLLGQCRRMLVGGPAPDDTDAASLGSSPPFAELHAALLDLVPSLVLVGRPRDTNDR